MIPASWRSPAVALALGLALAALDAPPPARAAGSATLPEFRHGSAEAWLHSPPLQSAELRGKVVLIDLFTTA